MPPKKTRPSLTLRLVGARGRVERQQHRRRGRGASSSVASALSRRQLPQYMFAAPAVMERMLIPTARGSRGPLDRRGARRGARTGCPRAAGPRRSGWSGSAPRFRRSTSGRREQPVDERAGSRDRRHDQRRAEHARASSASSTCDDAGEGEQELAVGERGAPRRTGRRSGSRYVQPFEFDERDSPGGARGDVASRPARPGPGRSCAEIRARHRRDRRRARAAPAGSSAAAGRSAASRSASASAIASAWRRHPDARRR